MNASALSPDQKCLHKLSIRAVEGLLLIQRAKWCYLRVVTGHLIYITRIGAVTLHISLDRGCDIAYFIR